MMADAVTVKKVENFKVPDLLLPQAGLVPEALEVFFFFVPYRYIYRDIVYIIDTQHTHTHTHTHTHIIGG